LIAIELLVLECVAQNHHARGAFTEQTQARRERVLVQRRYWRLIGLNPGPVNIGMI
jgi:cell division protein FtsL